MITMVSKPPAKENKSIELLQVKVNAESNNDNNNNNDDNNNNNNHDNNDNNEEEEEEEEDSVEAKITAPVINLDKLTRLVKFHEYAPELYGQQSMISGPDLSDSTKKKGVLRLLCTRISLPTVTTAILIINLIMFMVEMIYSGFAFDVVSLLSLGANNGYYVEYGQFWRLFTAMILHGGFLHYFNNNIIFMRIGYTLEARFKWYKFLVIYVISGFSCSLWSCTIHPSVVSIGASGAIMGLVAADLFYLYCHHSLITGGTFEFVVLAYIVISTLLQSIFNPLIDLFGHIGGLLAGALIAPLLLKRLPTFELKKDVWYTVGATISFAIMITVMLFVLLFANNPYRNLAK